MRKNKTKERLKAGETVFGCFVRYPNASLIEVLGYQPWDFIVFDAEHGTIQPQDCENMVRAAELQDVTPIVRVTTNQPHIILRLMDTGAQGLHVPWVNSAAEAEAVVRSVKYYPRGIRGLAAVRAADYALKGSFAEYVQTANQETLVVIHIETIEAVDQLPEIVKIDGVDVIFIGPTDLSHSLGVPGQPQHPSVQAAIDRIVDTVAGSNAALGIMVGNAQAAQQWRQRGARYISIGFESLLAPAAREYLEKVRV
ncbi:MAG: aldolase/citrate lyase family protein [Anaerolineae bacterium]